MQTIKEHSELEKFCDYFADISGYNNREEMFRDTEFIKTCKKFSEAVIDTAEKRNNASHGGSPISLNQCKEDKKIVLNDIQTIRESTMGLVQQLLYLILHKI